MDSIPESTTEEDRPKVFHPYPRLPDELKLAIWKQAVVSPAVHHFKLELPTINFEDPSGYDQVMLIHPINTDPRADASIWRDTWNYSAADTISREVIGPLEDQRTLCALEKQKVDRAKKKNNGESLRYGYKATIDASKDLVHFKLVGDDFDPWCLSRKLNYELLRGITRVAFDWNAGRGPGKEKWDMRPFECVCHVDRPHKDQQHCHQTIARFLSLIHDVETFYFVVKINGVSIDTEWLDEEDLKLQEKLQEQSQKQSQPQGAKRTHDGEVKRDDRPVVCAKPKPHRHKSAAELVEETMEFFRGIAEKKDREVFFDRKTTYYEVRRGDTQRLKMHDQIWTVIDGLRKRWRKSGKRLHPCKVMRERAGQTKFKVLVYSDKPKKETETTEAK